MHFQDLADVARCNHTLISYSWVSLPLVYTQLVTLAVYSYFAAALIGSQWVVPESSEAYRDLYKTSLGDQGAKLDLWYPFFLTLQFAFFVGWLKVAETLINPFGEDDDDFELMGLVNRHIRVCMEMVNDDREGQVPSVEDDLFWHPPVDAPKDWKPTFEIRPTQNQPSRSFSIKGLLNRNRSSRVVFPMEEETDGMQVESRDQGLVRRSSKPLKQRNGATDRVFQKSHSAPPRPHCTVEEEEEEEDSVVQVEPQ